MIINIEELQKQLSESNNFNEEFDLGNAIRSNEVDIIFCGNNNFEEVLNEYFNVYKDDENIKLMVRNGDEITQHTATAKVIFPKCPVHKGDRGIPILFQNNKWYVYLGKSDKHKSLTAAYDELIRNKKKIKKFLDVAAKEIGNELSEYSKCTSKDTEKMNQIISDIKIKYNINED